MATVSRPRKRQHRRKPQGKSLVRYFAPTATTSERVRGMLALGLTASEIAAVTQTTESSVRNWVAGGTQPRPQAAMALDYVRAVVKELLDGGMEPARALRWLTSLDPRHFGSERPIDALRTTPARVLTAATDAVLDSPSYTP